MLLHCSTEDTVNIVRHWKKFCVTLPCVPQLNFRQSSCFNWMIFLKKVLTKHNLPPKQQQKLCLMIQCQNNYFSLQLERHMLSNLIEVLIRPCGTAAQVGKIGPI